jgi:hypothetical protein
MTKPRHLAVLALAALAAAGCTVTWSGGGQTGPAATTGCTRASTSPRGGGPPLYEGMPAPIGGPDRPIYSFICTEAP